MSLPNYFYCQLCSKSEPHCTFRKLFKHIQYIHLGEPNFKIRCELGMTCGTTYSSFSGYKAHIYREHTTLLDVEPRKQEVQSYTDAANDETLDDICVDFDMERNHETEEELSENESQISCASFINWPLFNENLNKYNNIRIFLIIGLSK